MRICDHVLGKLGRGLFVASVLGLSLFIANAGALAL